MADCLPSPLDGASRQSARCIPGAQRLGDGQRDAPRTAEGPGGGADVGNVFGEERRTWFMVIVVAVREGSLMRWDESWTLNDIGKGEEEHSRLTWCNASHQTG